MAVGYSDRGTDLDALFDLRQSGDPQAADTEYHDINGVDLAARYVPISMGSGLGYSVGYASAGTDFSQIFAALGTVGRWPNPAAYDGDTYSNTAGAFDPNDATAEVSVTVFGDGTMSVSTADNFGTPTEIFRYNPLPNTVAATDVEVRCTQLNGQGALSNSMSAWTALNGSGTTVEGKVVYRVSQTTVGTITHTGDFTLEYRQQSDNTKGTTGTFTLTITSTVDSGV